MSEVNRKENGSLMTAVISERNFRRLGELIYTECGIKMPFSKKIMLEARLRKRLRVLGIDSFDKYCDYLFSPEGMAHELYLMINVVTTNKTDFFREPKHFEYLVNTAIPELKRIYGAGMNRPLTIWSAGCSTGEEPYTIAMALSEYREMHHAFSFTILATDIATHVLEKAKQGIYTEERIAPVPMAYRKKYLLKSKDRDKRLVRISPAVRSLVHFRRLNFMDEDFGMRELTDIIFCRNVIIYFDKPTQELLINRFCDHLIPGGYLFMGHSETLSGLKVPLVSAGMMVYKKPL